MRRTSSGEELQEKVNGIPAAQANPHMHATLTENAFSIRISIVMILAKRKIHSSKFSRNDFACEVVLGEREKYRNNTEFGMLMTEHCCCCVF